MRKLYFLVLFSVCLKLQAQYPVTSINITLPSNPDSKIANWGSGVNIFSINAMSKVVNGRIDPKVEGARILVIIKKSGGKICGSFTNSSAPAANFTSINKIWNGVNAVNLIGQDCTLTSGEYEVCVRFFGGSANEPLSEEKCKPFTIRSAEVITYQSPQLLLPANKSTIAYNGGGMPLSFRWTPLVPRPQETTTYRLQVWQLLQGQTAQQAVQVNQPITDEKITNATQTLVKNIGTDPCPPYTCNFVWRVQALDRDGKPIGTNNGASELFTFYLDKNTQETSVILQSPVNGAIIQSEQQTRFTWLPPKLDNQAAFYKIKIVEIIGDQSPEQAFKGNKPFFEKDSSLPFRIIARDVFKKGGRYGWQVQVFNNERKPIGGNEGKSKIHIFSVDNGNKRSVTVDTTTTPSENIDSSGTAAVGDSIRAGLNGEFIVLVTDMSVESNGSLTGKGTVRIPWLKSCVMVEFKKIRVDSVRRLTQGSIISTQSGSTASSYQTYPQAWANALLSGPGIANATDNFFEWTNDKVNNLVDWVNDLVPGKQPLINYNDTISTPALPNNCLKLPFGLVFKRPEDMLVITEMIFKPNESKINFVAQKLFTKGATDYKLGFAGKYFKIHPNRIEFANGRVELVEDIKVPNVVSNPKMTFSFKKGEPAKGCYIQWDSTGVNDIGIGMSVKFTRDWLVPVPYSTDSVKATISGNGTSLSDIILTGSLDTCKIVGTLGIKLQVDSVTWDLSEIRNPTSMYFPSNYTDDTTAQGKLLWQGLYIKKIKLTLPDAWKTGANPTQVQATNGIIDDQGVTLKISAKNIIQFPNGRLADMSASLDTLELSILKGSLTNGSAKGKLVLPISKDTITNTLKYTATFAQASTSNSFQIVVVPSGPIDADIFRGKMTLKPTSNISASLTDTSRSLSLNLNGSFDWGNKDLSVTDTTTATGGASIRKKGIKGIKMEMEFQNVSVSYNRNVETDMSKMTFNPGTWSFASPQKRLANFPVTIKKVYYKSLSTEAPTNNNFKELVRGALMIDIVANLTDDIGGKTTVGAAFAVEQDKSNFFKFNPKFKGVFIEDIEVHADMPAVKIDGKLKMYDNDPMYGDGFSATLGVKFTAVSVEANALVQFGNTAYNNNNQFYRYWRAEADVKFEPGIPFLPGIGFYGFGGGAFYNMEAIKQQRAVPGVGYKYTFKPKKSSLGFQVEATIATIPKFETFNADVSLLAQFTSSGGLTKIGFLGDFWLAAKLSEREPNPKIKGGVIVEYNFAQKIFYMGANLAINVPNVIKTTAPFGFVMNIDGTTNKWYFKAGTPTATNNIEIFGVNLYSYLMFGNDIPAPTGFTEKFANKYHAATGDWPNNGNVASSNGVGSNSATGKGIATGVGIEFSKDVTKELLNGVCRVWSIDGYVRAGAELNLALMQQTGCIGINGYRASGSIGLYGSVAATIRGASKGGGCDDKVKNLFVIKTGAWLTGKFPNPEYVAGSLTANINLFDGLINIPYSQSFQLGEDCSGTEVVTADVPAEDAAADLYNQLILSVTPTTKYQFPIASPINVKYALVPDKVFDVAENQGNGTILNRTFKLVVTRKLEMKNESGVWVDIPTNVRANNMGEYQYVKKTTSLLSGGTVSATTSQKLNTNSGNLFIGSNPQQLNGNTIPSPVPPPPPINYPNPIPELKNTLELNKDYRFTVEATLMEYKMNPVPVSANVTAGIGRGNGMELSWSVVRTKGSVNVVKQTKVVNFSTGQMPVVDANNINKGASKK